MTQLFLWHSSCSMGNWWHLWFQITWFNFDCTNQFLSVAACDMLRFLFNYCILGSTWSWTGGMSWRLTTITGRSLCSWTIAELLPWSVWTRPHRKWVPTTPSSCSDQDNFCLSCQSCDRYFFFPLSAGLTLYIPVLSKNTSDLTLLFLEHITEDHVWCAFNQTSAKQGETWEIKRHKENVSSA